MGNSSLNVPHENSFKELGKYSETPLRIKSLLETVGNQYNQIYYIAINQQLTVAFITRDSEGDNVSPCVFICLCFCHDICPGDLTMKDCCHTNDILHYN